MKPFDIELAKKGHPVCTRDGRPVKILDFDFNYNAHPIIAKICNKGCDTLQTYTKEGFLNNSIDTSDYDLFMVSEKKESEDEIRKAMIDFFKHEREEGITVLHYGVNIERMIAWLEKQGEHANFRNKIQIGDKVTRNEDGVLVNLSQLDRVAKKQGEQKPAWSEEDEETIDNLIDYLENELESSYMKEDKEGFRREISLLKSLKDRYTWKPSDEQMEVLVWCMPLFADPKSKGILESLINDLKKLKEK